MPLPAAEIQRGGKFEILSLHTQSLQLLISMNYMTLTEGQILFSQVGKQNRERGSVCFKRKQESKSNEKLKAKDQRWRKTVC